MSACSSSRQRGCCPDNVSNLDTGKEFFPMPTAVIYARYSSHAQRDASIDQQLAVCRAFAARGGIDVLDVYTDRALTGTNDNRPGFRRMITDAQKGRWSYVIVYALDRFSRDRYDAATNKHKLRQAGVKVISATEPISDEPAGILMESMLEGWAEYYSRELSAKVRRGHADNAKKCMTNGALPLGYRRGPDGKYEIVPEEAAIVREIFHRVAAGEPLTVITDDLNARGLRTKTRHAWNNSSYNNILTNVRYAGTYVYQDIRIPGGIPAIVTQSEFEAVQHAVSHKRNPRRAEGGPASRRRDDGRYLLTGKLFCGECQSPLVGVSGTARDGTLRHYYACKGRLNKTTACALKNIRQGDIEGDIATAIKTRFLTPDTIKSIADAAYAWQMQSCTDPDIPLLTQQLEDISRAIKNIMTAIEQGIFTASTRDRLQELEAEKLDISNRLSVSREHAKNLPTRQEIEAALTYYATGDLNDPLYREALIDAFLVRAYVYPDRYTIFFSPNASTAVDIPISTFSATDSTKETQNGSNKSPELRPHIIIRTAPDGIVFIGGIFRLICTRPSH